jgi:hypothetical protein
MEYQEEIIKLPSSEWIKQYGYIILDPDGWDRTNFDYSFNKELITKEEFEKRLSESTCQRHLKLNTK